MRVGDGDDPPMGWGRIRKELDPDGELGLHPGIGSIMGNASEPGVADGQPEDPGAQGRDRAADAKDRGADN
jgi:hypothetical protein